MNNMNDTANNTSMIFSIGVAKTQNGKTLKSLEPDNEGIYRKIPVGVLGAVSRNQAYYEVSSFIDCMVNPNSFFYKRLNEGHLKGENNHPLIKSKEELVRITIIDQNFVSHAILNLYTEKTADAKLTVIYLDIKPTGPYGDDLDKRLKDPHINVGFSLRSLTSLPIKRPDGVKVKKMISLITYDGADMPGFEYAAKRYTGGVESIQETEVTIADVLENETISHNLGLESFSTESLFNILGSDTINIYGVNNYMLNRNINSLYTSDITKSVFHTVFK